MKKTILFVVILAICSRVFAQDPDVSPTKSEAVDNPIVDAEFIFSSAPFDSCHASTIAQADDGSLVAAWFAGSREGADDVAIWTSRKNVDSNQWTTPVVAGNSDNEDEPCWNPVLFQPSDGPLLLFYKQGRKIAQWQGVLLSSDDFGKTWKDRRVLPEHFIGPVKNKPVELKDGTILCPTSTEHDGWRVHFEFIPALDKTWSRTDAINNDKEYEAIQPSVLFHKDGRLQALCRNKNGNEKLLQTWSDDGGRTWSKLAPTVLPNPCSGTDAVTLKDGRQLLVYNHSNRTTGNRSVLNVAISDDGISWNAVCVLENSPGEYSYPSVIQTRDGLVHIVYTWKRERIKHVTLDPSNCVGAAIIDGVWPDSVQ